MKKLDNNIFNKFAFSLIFITIGLKPFAQDSIKLEQLLPFVHTFNIIDGKLVGSGADFLREEFANSQFTMLGEYHNSQRISEFTLAIIPELQKFNYKTIVTEIGPSTGNWLNTINGNLHEIIKLHHEKYFLKDNDGFINTSFPFFSNVADVDFLQKLKDENWNLIGIDQEYYYSYIFLIDRMYDNFSDKKLIEKSYKEVKDSLIQYYTLDFDNKTKVAVSITNSRLISEFLEIIETDYKCKNIATAFRESVMIYKLYADRKWYENNEMRVKYMKKMLKQNLELIDFDLKSDKMLIKMGGYHLSKGLSPLALFEIGNTLNEIAAYNGNKALNITFSNRYYYDKDSLIDILQSQNQYDKLYNDFNQIGKKDEWVVLDLRPLVKGFFYYPKKFKLNKQLEDIISRYDLLVIPKTEVDAKLIYSID